SSLFHIFFFIDSATPEIYTLSLHDALPIWFPGRHRQRYLDRHTTGAVAEGMRSSPSSPGSCLFWGGPESGKNSGQGICAEFRPQDRKSTRLNSSHSQISYAVFCLKKKKK